MEGFKSNNLSIAKFKKQAYHDNQRYHSFIHFKRLFS